MTVGRGTIGSGTWLLFFFGGGRVIDRRPSTVDRRPSTPGFRLCCLFHPFGYALGPFLRTLLLVGRGVYSCFAPRHDSQCLIQHDPQVTRNGAHCLPHRYIGHDRSCSPSEVERYLCACYATVYSWPRGLSQKKKSGAGVDPVRNTPSSPTQELLSAKRLR